MPLFVMCYVHYTMNILLVIGLDQVYIYLYMSIYIYIYIYTQTHERVVSIVVIRILLIIGASRRPGREPLEDSVQVISKLSPGKWNSQLTFILSC